MFYGYVGGPIRTVITDFKKVERLALIYPYSSYRKFWDEGAAWSWLSQQPYRKLDIPESIYRYGNIFKDSYVSIEYFIGKDNVVANINTRKLGNVKIKSMDENISILNKTGMVEVEIKNLALNPDLIISHIIAIINVLDLVGPFVDAEVKLPNHSVFFALTKYTGDKRQLVRMLERLKKRKGQVAWTLEEYIPKEDEE